MAAQEVDVVQPSRRKEDAHICAEACETGWSTCLRRPRISLVCDLDAVDV